MGSTISPEGAFQHPTYGFIVIYAALKHHQIVQFDPSNNPELEEYLCDIFPFFHFREVFCELIISFAHLDLPESCVLFY